MTIKELIEANASIVEVYITLRGDYFGDEFKDSVYVHEFGIGSFASFGNYVELRNDFGKGKRGSKFKEPCTLINKEINSRAEKDHWSVSTKAFPKSVLNLEVTAWHTSNAYSWKSWYKKANSDSACVIRIECWLPPDYVNEIKIEQKETEHLEGQINLLDILE